MCGCRNFAMYLPTIYAKSITQQVFHHFLNMDKCQTVNALKPTGCNVATLPDVGHADLLVVFFNTPRQRNVSRRVPRGH